jgi:alkylation response protein AidB-like acyl-CoA dehydrogenase
LSWSDKLDRLSALEGELGSPHARGSLTFARSLQLDESEAVPLEEYRTLAHKRLQRLFVPVSLGGGLRDLDELVLSMRSIFRRDPTVGLGFGINSFVAALPVWQSGRPEQQQRLAASILSGSPVAAAFHEPAHVNDLPATEFQAAPREDGFVLTGQTNAVNNMGRAAAAMLFVRTGSGDGMHEHSLVLLDEESLARGELLPRTRTLGARACELRSWRASGLELPASALVGAQGLGFDIVAQAYQITRAILPGMVIGIADTAWRMCYRFLSQRVLYGGRAIDLPLVRRDLSTAFIDIMAADVLSLAVVRMAHVMPGQLSLASSVAQASVTACLSGVMNRLSVMLGARHYVREGDFGFFQKLVRDMPFVTIGQASSDVCLSLLVAQFPTLAKFSRMRSSESCTPLQWETDGMDKLEAIFRLRRELPELSFDQPTLSTPGGDSILQDLPALLAQLRVRGHADRAVGVRERILYLGTVICERYEALIEEISGRLTRDPLDQPVWVVLAKRYAQLYSATCALYCWYFNREDASASVGMDGVSFEILIVRVLEQQLRVDSIDSGWIDTALLSMQQCAEQGLSAGLLRMPYAEGAPAE